MLIKWRTRSYPPTEIKRVECTRETEKCVFYMRSGETRKSHKYSEFEQYHDTWADAKAYLVRRAQAQVDAYKERLHAARSLLGQAESLKEPEEV